MEADVKDGNVQSLHYALLVTTVTVWIALILILLP